MVLTKCDLVDGARLQTVLGEVRELLALALPGLRPPCGQQEEEEEEALEVRRVGRVMELCPISPSLPRPHACSPPLLPPSDPGPPGAHP